MRTAGRVRNARQDMHSTTLAPLPETVTGNVTGNVTEDVTRRASIRAALLDRIQDEERENQCHRSRAGRRHSRTWRMECDAYRRAEAARFGPKPDVPLADDTDLDWLKNLSERLQAARLASERAQAAPVAPLTLARRPEGAVIPDRCVGVYGNENDLADAVYEHATGRLAYIRDDNTWIMFTAGDGWRAKPEDTVLKALATFSGLNLGTVDKDGIAKMDPRTGGRAATAAGVMRLLKGLAGSDASTWDADTAYVGVGGDVLNLTTGARRMVFV